MPRLRVFAGPNGSGKSSLLPYLQDVHFGVYVNADEIEKDLRRDASFDLSRLGVVLTDVELMDRLRGSRQLKKSGTGNRLNVQGGIVHLAPADVDSYVAAAIADIVRNELLAARKSFAFETVMSHGSKVEIMRQARGLGYKVYLYFVATDDPTINIGRVQMRVRSGGHYVPADRIIDRYNRSLDNLYDAIQCSNRAYVFDNSQNSRESVWLAEATNGEVEVLVDVVPPWFDEYVLCKMIEIPEQD